MPSSNLMIVQGGGPTAVFNASLAAIIEKAQLTPRLDRIYGARFGLRGLLQSEIVDLTSVPAAQLKMLRRTPGAALGSSRHSPSEDEMASLPRILAKLGVGAMIFMGGNGTMFGARTVSELCRHRGIEISVIGVPKTIDNDLGLTARCPGYGSAARYAAAATRELAADVRSLPQPVSILETLGRNVGWIAAATALARHELSSEMDAPHLIYIPEVPFIEEEFLDRLQEIVRNAGWAVVTVAEGLRRADGGMVYQAASPGQADPLKRPLIGGVSRYLADLVSMRLRMRCRTEMPGLLGRAATAYVSSRDLEDATVVGRDAVTALANGHRDVMVALNSLSGDKPSSTSLVPLDRASGEERSIPSDWLCKGSIPVNEKFLEYVRPLVGPLDGHISQLGDPIGTVRA